MDKDITIVIHAIPHTHLDAGWVETFDYYYSHFVIPMMESLIKELEENSHYRFNWAETGYLQHWWTDEKITLQPRFKALFDRGQIQFVGGGWVAHDEATVEYFNAMEQLEAGWRFLNQTFGVVPHVGWQLDSFGNSAVTPSLMAQYGIDTLFIARLSTNIKEKLRYDGNL